MEIEQKARILFENLLREISEDVREEFRQKALEEAAKVAALKEMTILEEEAIVIGFILATPSYLKDRLRKILSYNGVDTSPYENYL